MAVFDWNGTTKIKNKKIVDWDGTVNRNIKKLYDWNGTANHLIYSAWNGELLDKNNQFTEITGGWGSTMQFTSLSAVEAPINEQGILFNNFGKWQKKNTINKIDVTQFNTIELDISCPQGIYTNNFYFGIYNNLTDAHNNAIRLAQTTIDKRTGDSLKISLDVQGISGQYYVSIATLVTAPYSFTVNKSTLKE